MRRFLLHSLVVLLLLAPLGSAQSALGRIQGRVVDRSGARFTGPDNHGHRAEFIRLLGIAAGLSRLATVADRRE